MASLGNRLFFNLPGIMEIPATSAPDNASSEALCHQAGCKTSGPHSTGWQSRSPLLGAVPQSPWKRSRDVESWERLALVKLAFGLKGLG